jgi:hypothetical protein
MMQSDVAGRESKKTLDEIIDEVQSGSATVTSQAMGNMPTDHQGSGTAAPPAGGLGALLSSPGTVQMLGKLLAGGSSGGLSGEGKKKNNPDAVALLCALQPYLGERRSATVDSVLQMLRLRKLLQAIPWRDMLTHNQP